MKRSIDSDLLDQEQSDRQSYDFEEIYKRLEKLKLGNQISKAESTEIEKIISDLDNYFQDLLDKKNDADTKKSFIYAENLIKTWLKCNTKSADYTFYHALSNNLIYLRDELKSKPRSLNQLVRKLDVISNRQIYSKIKSHTSPLVYSDKQNYSIIDTSTLPFKPKYYWDINVILHGDSFLASPFAEFLLVFSSALEYTDGCCITIGEIKTGSLISQLRIWFKNLKAKEEIKKILHLGRKSAEGYLEKYSSENEKIKRDTEKTQAEIELLTNQIKSVPTDLLIERERLLNMKLKAEVENLELENVKKRIDVVNSFSDLFARNLLKPQSMEIFINKMLYIGKEENVLSIGVDLNSIDSETKNLK